jgi:hypothetical protein
MQKQISDGTFFSSFEVEDSNLQIQTEPSTTGSITMNTFQVVANMNTAFLAISLDQ